MDNLLDGITDIASGGAFLALGVIGLLALILAVLLDGVFDAFDLGDGPFSILSLAAFVTLFGLVGYFAVAQLGFDVVIAALIGVGAGAVASLLAWGMTQYLRKNDEANLATSLDTFAGREGTLSEAIRAGDGVGAIIISHHGTRLTLSASSAGEAIPLHSPVRIVRMVSNSLALVELVTAPTTTNKEG